MRCSSTGFHKLALKSGRNDIYAFHTDLKVRACTTQGRGDAHKFGISPNTLLLNCLSFLNLHTARRGRDEGICRPDMILFRIKIKSQYRTDKCTALL